ncbi:MAG: FAD-dependent monooxygenase [Pseudonocardia sp.]
MRVAVVGAGPGGLFLATLLRRALPSWQVTVFERNRADDTFGFGVVFSDRTLARIHEADPVLREALDTHGVHWDVIEVRLKGERISCGGNGMAAVRRQTLLRLMQARAAEAGAQLRFSCPVELADLSEFDLVVGADGTGSRLRDALASELEPSVETATAKFIWFGTDYAFDGLTFVHERGPHGVFAVHGYPIGDGVSTFIVETDEASWRAAGLDEFDVTQPPGASDERSRAYLEALYADRIDGAKLLVNNSRWANFRTRRTARWNLLSPLGRVGQALAFLGDAVHTAHFSVGSGTKMAMEDAIALSAALASHPADLGAALAAYEAAARPSVEAIQGSARPSLSWWEHFGRYHDAFEPWQFAYHFLSRSISDAQLARRDAGFVGAAHAAWEARHGAEVLASPLEVGSARFGSRVAERAPFPLHDHRSEADSDVGGRSSHQNGDHGVWIQAPDDEAGLPGAFAALADAVAGGAALVAVRGGTPLTRTLVCEQARLHHGVAALLVDPELDRDRAVTAILSGRADLVAPDLDAWGGP